MNRLPRLFRVNIYLLISLLIVLTCFYAKNVLATLTEEELATEIDRQETGRLPGARILPHGVAGSNTSNPSTLLANRNDFTITVEFNPYIPEPDGTERRIIRTPGPPKFPNCYYENSDDGITFTDDCDASTPPRDLIENLYLEDGTVIFDNDPGTPEPPLDPASPRLQIGTNEGDEILYDPNNDGNFIDGVLLYLTPNEFERYPADGSRITSIPWEAGLLAGDGSDQAALEASGYEAGTSFYLSRNTVNYAEVTLTYGPCDRDISAPGDPSMWTDGWGYDYDGPDGELAQIAPDGVMYYPPAEGMPIFNESCDRATQCVPQGSVADVCGTSTTNPAGLAEMNGADPKFVPISSGNTICELTESGGTYYCQPVRVGQRDPVRNILGPLQEESCPVPLFLQRFWEDYDNVPAVRNDLINLALLPGFSCSDPGAFDYSSVPTVTVDITPASSIPALPAPYDNTLISLQAVYEGDYVCVYAYSSDASVQWRIETAFPQTIEEVMDLVPVANEDSTNTSDLGDANASNVTISNKHCMQAPYTPVIFQTLNYNELIDPICLAYRDFTFGGDTVNINGEAVTFQNRWERPFTSFVVECIERTLMNIFIGDEHEYEDPNGAVINNLTFYESIQYKFRSLVYALLVLYVIFFGYRLMISRNPPDRSEIGWFMLRVTIIIFFTLGDGITQLFPEMIDIQKDLSVTVMEAGLDQSQDNGYDLCDFRNHTGAPYATDFEYMRLWDTIDCKLSKYLGIGDNKVFHDDGTVTRTWHPQILWIGATSAVSTYLGIPIFIITVIVLIFLILVTIRAVHIYIMAFIGLLMLMFISPLIIPAALFKYTKDIFDRWFKQVFSYLIQPIILFGFLSFAFVTFDVIFFGENENFVPITTDTVEVPYRLAGSGPFGEAMAYSDCDDENAIGCIYQVAGVREFKPLERLFPDFIIYQAAIGDKALALFVGLLKLLLIAFISKILIDMVEELAFKLTNDGLGGLLGAGSPPVVGPGGAMGAQAAVMNAGVQKMGSSFGMVGRGGARAMAMMRAGTGGQSMAEDDRAVRAAGGKGGLQRDNSFLGKEIDERAAVKKANQGKKEHVDSRPKDKPDHIEENSFKNKATVDSENRKNEHQNQQRFDDKGEYDHKSQSEELVEHTHQAHVVEENKSEENMFTENKTEAFKRPDANTENEHKAEAFGRPTDSEQKNSEDSLKERSGDNNSKEKGGGASRDEASKVDKTNNKKDDKSEK
jgi:type IV secretory pathway VirB6-like protein